MKSVREHARHGLQMEVVTHACIGIRRPHWYRLYTCCYYHMVGSHTVSLILYVYGNTVYMFVGIRGGKGNEKWGEMLLVVESFDNMDTVFLQASNSFTVILYSETAFSTYTLLLLIYQCLL